LKILFLSYAYPPKRYPRSIQVSHLVYFLKQSLNIEVVTSSTVDIEDKTLLMFTTLDNVTQVKNSPLTNFIWSARGNRIKQMILPDQHYLWHFDLYDTASKIIEDNCIDLIITFGQPMSSHITGLKLKNKFSNLKWIAHFSDPWVDNMFNRYNFWTRLVNKHYQDKVFKLADKLIFTSIETINLVMSNYQSSIKSKAEYLPHCFNDELYPTGNTENETFMIRHIGNFYADRKPECLFKALSLIPANQLENIKIELIGTSDSSIEDSIKTYSLEKIVSAVPAVNYLESLSLMRSSDLLLIIDAAFESSPFLPSKLIDYIGANKPIFGITPQGTSQKLIEEMGFLTAHPKDPAKIASKLIDMIKSIKERKFYAIPNSIRDRYDVQTIGNHMKDMMLKVIATTKRENII